RHLGHHDHPRLGDVRLTERLIGLEVLGESRRIVEGDAEPPAVGEDDVGGPDALLLRLERVEGVEVAEVEGRAHGIHSGGKGHQGSGTNSRPGARWNSHAPWSCTAAETSTSGKNHRLRAPPPATSRTSKKGRKSRAKR